MRVRPGCLALLFVDMILLLTPFTAEAQQAGKEYTLGIGQRLAGLGMVIEEACPVRFVSFGLLEKYEN